MDRFQKPFLATLRLPIATPQIVVKLQVLAYTVALFAPWFSSISLIFKVILSIFPIVGLCYIINKTAFFMSNKSVAELILGIEDDWQVKLKDGEVYEATLADSMFVHPLLTIILLKYEGCADYFIFTPSNTDADLFRRLRVRLRFKLNASSDKY